MVAPARNRTTDFMWIEEKGQRLAKDLAKGEDKPETSVKVGTEVERSRGMHRMAKNVICCHEAECVSMPFSS